MSERLTELEHNLKQACGLDECESVLKLYLEEKQFIMYSFTYYAYHPHSNNKIKYDMCSSRFKLWHQHYLREQYNTLDSTLSTVYHTHLPVYWNIEQQLAEATSEREYQMRKDSIEFGTQSGLSIPIHGPHNNFAILLVVQMQGQDCQLELVSTQHKLFVAAHLYYHFIQKHLINSVSENESYNLSVREIQCLQLLAKQFSLSQTATHLELTERTINYHLQRLNKKLGCKNKYQSLAKAIELGLLTL